MKFEDWYRVWASDNKLAGLKGTAKAAWDAGRKVGYEEGKEDHDPLSTTAQPFET